MEIIKLKSQVNELGNTGDLEESPNKHNLVICYD